MRENERKIEGKVRKREREKREKSEGKVRKREREEREKKTENREKIRGPQDVHKMS